MNFQNTVHVDLRVAPTLKISGKPETLPNNDESIRMTSLGSKNKIIREVRNGIVLVTMGIRHDTGKRIGRGSYDARFHTSQIASLPDEYADQLNDLLKHCLPDDTYVLVYGGRTTKCPKECCENPENTMDIAERLSRLIRQDFHYLSPHLLKADVAEEPLSPLRDKTVLVLPHRKKVIVHETPIPGAKHAKLEERIFEIN